MNALLDIIVVVIAVATIYFAVKNGFIKTLLSASSFLLAVIITALLLSPVKTAIKETDWADNLQVKVEESIEGMLADDNIQDIEELAKEEENPGTLVMILDKVGIDHNTLADKFEEWKAETGGNLKQRFVDYVSTPIVNGTITVVAVVALFFGSLIILKLTTFILDKVFNLPVLKTANKLFGFLLGILLAGVRVYLFALLVKLILPFGQSVGVEFLKNLNPDATLLFKVFYNFNLFSFLS